MFINSNEEERIRCDYEEEREEEEVVEVGDEGEIEVDGESEEVETKTLRQWMETEKHSLAECYDLSVKVKVVANIVVLFYYCFYVYIC